MKRPWKFTPILLAFGGLAFLIAVLSIVDMFLPRPFDGIVLDPDVPSRLLVLNVNRASGAAAAGIQPGDEVEGIARNLVKGRRHAARLLSRHSVGDEVDYFIRRDGRTETFQVKLGERRHGTPSYLYACLLGFSFFFVGLFVLTRQPRLRASRVFFILSNLFLLFLVCRLRPESYSQVDTLILWTGTAALLLLPASFLHFFLIFPRPVPILHRLGLQGPDGTLTTDPDGGAWRRFLLTMYLLPTLVMAATLVLYRQRQEPLPLISGAPVANWWVLALYVVLGLTALAVNARVVKAPRERRGAALVLTGALFGLVPFLVLAVAFPSFLHTEKFLFYGVLPLGLVPLTFAYAIVRFQLLDIRVILRKGLLYTLTTAVVTGLYALGIAFFNSWFSGTAVAASRFFPLVFALVIVLLFEPLRRRIQGPIDRFFDAERSSLQRAMVEMGEALTARGDLKAVVRDLVRRLPDLLGLHFAALYLVQGDHLERAAGPGHLPARLPLLPELADQLRRQSRKLFWLHEMERLASKSEGLLQLKDSLMAGGVEVVADLSSPRRRIGVVLLSDKKGHIAMEPADMDLLQGLFSQAAIALETRILLEEQSQRHELERELQIAAAIQNSLLPSSVELGPGWRVAAVCRPARDVGGDFFAQLAGPTPGSNALVYGDVSGKSISGALMMMAVREVLYTLSVNHPQPEELFRLANERLYALSRRSFVALGYLTAHRDNDHLIYALAGQPPPLRRAADGAVEELHLPEHRLPLGAFTHSNYRLLETPVAAGDLILAYSDGVVETQAPSGEFFGFDRLAQVLGNGSDEPHAVVQQVLDALDEFAGGREPYDDITLLAVGRQQETD